MPTATTRHGTIHYEKSQVVHVLGGLVGFPDATHYVLLESEEVEPFRWLVSVDQPELSFLVIDPRLLVLDFEYGLTSADRSRLGIDERSEVLPLVIAVISDEPEGSTANLRAPLIVNSTRMVAAQIVLTDGEHSVRHPLLPQAGG